MTIKTIFSAVHVEDKPIQNSSINYAVSMATMTNAQLLILIGVQRLAARSGTIIPEVPELVDAANAERRTIAEAYGAKLKKLGKDLNLTIEIVSDNYIDIRNSDPNLPVLVFQRLSYLISYITSRLISAHLLYIDKLKA
jgi:hypothetical protein